MQVAWVSDGVPPPSAPGIVWQALPAEHPQPPQVPDLQVWWCPTAAHAEERLRASAWLAHEAIWAVVLVVPGATPAQRAAWLRSGVQDVLDSTEAAALHRALQHAQARKQREALTRLAYATDLATGLPHQAQLIEHMAHLLALREREPSPMVLIALRLQGLERAADAAGGDAAPLLRRKVAVRLRSKLRAGDVVASIQDNSFGVLLGHVEAASDGEHVLRKLVSALHTPFQAGGRTFDLQVSAGLACYPEHGRKAAELLQRALAQAGGWAPMGEQGHGHLTSRSAAEPANDPR